MKIEKASEAIGRKLARIMKILENTAKSPRSEVSKGLLRASKELARAAEQLDKKEKKSSKSKSKSKKK